MVADHTAQLEERAVHALTALERTLDELAPAYLAAGEDSLGRISTLPTATPYPALGGRGSAFGRAGLSDRGMERRGS